jgi:gas vesicle protein
MTRDGWANFFLGLGVGVGVGLLIAPKSGEETREFLRTKADEGKDFLKQQTAGLTDDLKERTEDLRARSNDLVARGKDILSRQKDVLSDAIEAGKQAYRDKVEPTPPAESA